jgi:hypothetical protein
MMSNDNIWAGVGGKLTAQLGPVGAESFSGIIFGRNSKGVIQARQVLTDGFRIGAGLGASVGLSVFVGKSPQFESIEERSSAVNFSDAKSILDGVNGQIALPGTKIAYTNGVTKTAGALAKFLGNNRGTVYAAKSFIKVVDSAKNWDEFRTLCSALYTAASAGLEDERNEFMMIVDVPFVGFGAEISLNITISQHLSFFGVGQASESGIYDVICDKWHWKFYLHPNGVAKWQDVNNMQKWGAGRWSNLADQKVIRWFGGIQSDEGTQSYDIFAPKPKSNKMPDSSWRNVFANGVCKTDNKEYSSYVFWNDEIHTEGLKKNAMPA